MATDKPHRDLPAINQHWMKLYDKKFLHAGNLFDAEKGTYRTATVTIERFEEREKVDMGDGRKANARILHFKGKQTPMIVTPKMAVILVRMFGRTPADCEGKTITLYVETDVNTQKGTGDVLRIRNDKAAAGLKRKLRAPEPPPPEDEEPGAPVMAPEEFGNEPREPGQEG